MFPAVAVTEKRATVKVSQSRLAKEIDRINGLFSHPPSVSWAHVLIISIISGTDGSAQGAGQQCPAVLARSAGNSLAVNSMNTSSRRHRVGPRTPHRMHAAVPGAYITYAAVAS